MAEETRHQKNLRLQAERKRKLAELQRKDDEQRAADDAIPPRLCFCGQQIRDNGRCSNGHR